MFWCIAQVFVSTQSSDLLNELELNYLFWLVKEVVSQPCVELTIAKLLRRLVAGEEVAMNTADPIPFAAFARFRRLTAEKPLLYCEPPAWAAASHAIVVDDTVHYLWAQKREEMVAGYTCTALRQFADPTAVTHDQRNPILLPSANGFDNHGVEYPFPFWNPADQRYYAYYLGTQGKGKPRRKQTGPASQRRRFRDVDADWR